MEPPNLPGSVEEARLLSAGLDFPSPASDIDIFTPTAPSLNATSNPWPGVDVICPSSAISPVPDTVVQPSVLTPAYELERSDLLGFDKFVGTRVAPAPTSPLPLSSSKVGSDLRLPSFAQLGIAAPHSEPPRRPSLARNPLCLGDPATALPQAVIESESVAALPVDHRVGDAVHEHVDTWQPDSEQPYTRDPLHSPLHHYVTTLTPPDDNGRITWEAITKIATGPMNTPATETGGVPLGSDAPTATAADTSGVPQIKFQASTPLGEATRPWLEDAIQIMRESCSDLATWS